MCSFMRVLALLLLASVLLGGRVEAAPILGGSVSFDSATNRFTYSYVLNNRAGPAPINELSILINSFLQDPFFNPAAHTEPPGWNFSPATSGTSALPPLNEFGTFWRWFNSTGVPVGAVLSGFSFTTDRGPTLGTTNNYFLFSSTFSGGPEFTPGILEFGHIVAPDFAVPEPPTFALLGIGALGLMGSCWRRRTLRRRFASPLLRSWLCSSAVAMSGLHSRA